MPSRAPGNARAPLSFTVKAKLSQAHRKFVTRLLAGASTKEAYQHAFPEANDNTARCNGTRLRRRPYIQAELAALREKGDALPGSDFLTYLETRKYFARVVRAQAAELPDSSDLWNVRKSAKSGLFLRFPDKLRALWLDAKLGGYDRRKAGEGPGSEEDALRQLLERVREKANGAGPVGVEVVASDDGAVNGGAGDGAHLGST